jgi:lysyl-tRNA synthetase class 2
MAMLDEIRQARLKKLEAVKKAGLDPYPETAKRTHTLKEANEKFDDLLAEEKEIIVAGRIMNLRPEGVSFFADLCDDTGKIAAIFGKNKIGPKGFDFFENVFDEGDIIEVRGWPAKFGGEKAIEAVDYRMLAKSLNLLPKHLRGFFDGGEKLSECDGGERGDNFCHSAIVAEMAGFLKGKGFSDAYFLKRPFWGGFGKIFEIGKGNAGESHGLDSGKMEILWGCADYRIAMELAEEMIFSAVKAAGKTEAVFQGKEISFERPWSRIEYADLFEKRTGIKYPDANEKAIAERAKNLGLDIAGKSGKAFLADVICEKACWPELEDPTFVLHSPKGSLVPARQLEKHPDKLADCRLIAGGVEIVNIFSELNDPAEIKEREGGLSGVRCPDVIEYGLPPAARISVNLNKLDSLLSEMETKGRRSLPSSAGGRKEKNVKLKAKNVK